MAKLFRRSKEQIGSPPGTIIDQGEQKTNIEVIDYSETTLEEKKFKNIQECFQYKDKSTITWINIEGADADILKQIDDFFGIHPLVAEDIITVSQRPKFEDYGQYAFLIAKMIYIPKDSEDICAEQVSFIIGPNYVFSFQEKEGDVFDHIRERIRTSKGRIRKMGADYLAYSLIDAIVDNYFLVLEKKADEIEALEDEIISDETQKISQEIHSYKRDIVFLRRQIWPLREVLSVMQRSESKLIEKKTMVYLRDVYDHTIQVMDTVESFRDMLSGMHDLYLSNISNKTNEVMKVLTIFATIFIPLTFIAGIYGMNFEYMPELNWRYGYFGLLFFMALVAGTMIVYFRKRKWF